MSEKKKQSATASPSGGWLTSAHVALFISIPVLTLLAPTMKEKTLSLFQSSTSTQAYSGDSILIGDSETSVPFTSINWKITQQPGFGDSYQVISIFVVPERVARRHLYRYESTYDSSPFFPTDLDSNTLPLRSYIYLLPKKYHDHKQEPRAEFIVKFNYASSLNGEEMIASVCPFNNRVQYSDFLDMEPGAVRNAKYCSRMLGDVENHCSPDDRNCTDALRALTEMTASKTFSENSVFQSTVSSYNFFAAIIHKNSWVRYEANVVMYFYKHTALEKYHMCTIRGTDSCLFATPGVFKKSWFWSKRHIVIAYIHPNSVPSSLTSRIVVEADVQQLEVITVLLLCFTIVYLVIRHCFHSYLPSFSG